MRQLVPEFIVNQYDAGRNNGRFLAATLVIDISGFTAMTEAILQHGWQNTEILADVMQHLFDPLIEQVYAHGGFIANFAGDAFTAIFPQSDPCDETDWLALAAAWRCQEALTANAHQHTPLGDFSFALRLGLGWGEVQWEILPNKTWSDEEPNPERVEAAYYFGGQGIDACLEALRQATPGELLLSSPLYGRLARWLDANARGRLFQLIRPLRPLPALKPFDVAAQPACNERDFTPDSVRQLRSRGEFRQVVTLFILLQNATDLYPIMQEVFRLQKRYGGYLNTVQFSDKGCNLLLFWGMPRSHENDVERALAFTLALATAVGPIFRAGLTYQPMFAGFVGGSWRQEYSVYGRGVNLAARLMTQASWGSFWLDERLNVAAPASFLRRNLGLFTFKGFQRPQPAYQLLGQQQEGEPAHYEQQLVGRQDELNELIRFIAPLDNGRFAGSLTIQGEMGLGKTRLLRAFLQSWPVALKCHYLMGECDGTSHEPLFALRRALRRHFNQEDRLPEEENWRRFSAAYQQLQESTTDPDLRQSLEEATPFLANLVSPHWIPPLAREMSPQWRWQNSFTALKNFFKAESLRRPLLICLEDINWLDAESRDFLTYLSHNLDTYPIAIIATARPEGLPLFDPDERWDFPTETLKLGRLTVSDVYLLSGYLLDGPVDMALAQLLTERSAGNPLFAGQILLYLRDQGHLIRSETGRWRLSEAQPESDLPADIRAIFTARLDGLSPEMQKLTQTAAVLGQEFDLATLAHMLPEDSSVGKWLNEGEKLELWTTLSNGRCRFNHFLLREVAYEMQLLAQRRNLHLAAATALETLYRDRQDDFAADLAHHYERGGQWETAVSWYWQAARQAMAQYANSSALHYLDRALNLIPPENLRLEYDLRLDREHIYNWSGDRARQTAELGQLNILAGQLDGEAETTVLLRRVKFAIAVGEKETAVTQARQCVTLAKQSGSLEQQAQAHRCLGQALWGLNQYEEAQQHALRALHLAQALAQPKLIADCLNGLGIILDDQGMYHAARNYYLEALAQQQEIGDLAGQITSRNNLGYLAFIQGQLDVANIEYTQSLALCHKVGHKKGESSLLNNVGVISFMYGDFLQAGYTYQQGLDLCREIGNRGGEANTLTNLALLEHYRDRPTQAEAYAREAIHISRRWDFPLTLAEALTYLGHIRWGQGDEETAVSAYKEAITLYQQVAQERRAIEARAALARLLVERGETAVALAEVEKIEPQLRNNQLEGVMNPYDVYLNAYWVCRAAGNECAGEILDYAYKRMQAQASKIQQENIRELFLNNHRAQRELVTLWAAVPVS